MEPQCCSQAQEQLYSAPGKGCVPCLILPPALLTAGEGFCRQQEVPSTVQPLVLPASSSNASLALSAEVGGIAEPTEAADCWSFGSLLYELLTGVVRGRGAVQGVGRRR